MDLKHCRRIEPAGCIVSACGYAHGGKPRGPVEGFGMTFENDEMRREHSFDVLCEGLKELYPKLDHAKREIVAARFFVIPAEAVVNAAAIQG